MKTIGNKTLIVTLIVSLFAFGACGVEDDDGSNAPNCVGDCTPDPDPAPVCGNDVCDDGETAETCADDCAEPDPCDDGSCDPVCGNDVCEDGEDADNCADDCAEPEPEYAVCPFMTDGKYVFNVAGKYVSGATKGEIRFFTEFSDGSHPNPAVSDSNASGYLGMFYELGAGIYKFSYLGYQYSSSCSGGDCPVAWAQYGGKDVLNSLSDECRAFIQCNWWDADKGEEVSVDCAECALQVEVHEDGTITGAGNMFGF